MGRSNIQGSGNAVRVKKADDSIDLLTNIIELDNIELEAENGKAVLSVNDKIEECNIHRNYIKSCALDEDGNADLLHLTGAATIAEQVGIVLGTDTNESAYVVNGQFNISGDGENTQNYDQTYTLKTPLTLTTSVQVTLHQWAAHRAGSNIYAYAIFDDGTSQQVGFLTGGGDTNQTQTFTIQVEQKTLTGIRITAHSSAWSNGYAGRGANTAGIYVTHYVATSAGIELNVSEDKPLKYVPSDGVSRNVTIPFGKDFQSYNDGTFFVFLDNNNISTTIRYTINKVAPTSPVDGDYWLDTSIMPTQLKKYVETTVTTGEGGEAVTKTIKEWENVNDIYIGNVTVASHVITKVEQPKIGIFGNINNASSVQPATVIETYKNGASWYRVWSDGWCEQGGTMGVTAQVTGVTLSKPYKDTNYTCVGIQSNINNEGYHTVNVGKVNNSTIQLRVNPTGSPIICWITEGYIN